MSITLHVTLGSSAQSTLSPQKPKASDNHESAVVSCEKDPIAAMLREAHGKRAATSSMT